MPEQKFFRISVDNRSAIQAVDQLSRAIDKTGATTRKVAGDIKQVDKSVEGLGKRFLDLKTVVSSTVGFMAAQIGVEMLTSIENAVRGIMQFDAEMQNVASIMTGPGAGSITKLREELLKLPPELGDITQLAKGLYETISAGVEPAYAIQFLESAARAAQAGLADMNSTVKLGASIINAYGLSVSDAGRVFDIMLKAVDQGITTLPELANSFGRLTPIASMAGLKLEEVTAAVVALTKQGQSTDEAVTAIRQAIVGIISPAESSRKLFDELGVSYGQAALQSKGLIGVLAELREKVGSNTEALSQMFPNIRAIQAIVPLMGAGFSELVRQNENLKNSAGKVNDAFREQQKSVVAAFETFKGAVQRVIAANAAFSPFTITLQGLTKVVEVLGPHLNELALGIGAVVVAMKLQNIQLATNAFLNLGSALASARTWLASFASTAGGAVAAIALVAEATKLWTDNIIEWMGVSDEQMALFQKEIISQTNAQAEAKRALKEFADAQGITLKQLLESRGAITDTTQKHYDFVAALQKIKPEIDAFNSKMGEQKHAVELSQAAFTSFMAQLQKFQPSVMTPSQLEESWQQLMKSVTQMSSALARDATIQQPLKTALLSHKEFIEQIIQGYELLGQKVPENIVHTANTIGIYTEAQRKAARAEEERKQKLRELNEQIAAMDKRHEEIIDNIEPVIEETEEFSEAIDQLGQDIQEVPIDDFLDETIRQAQEIEHQLDYERWAAALGAIANAFGDTFLGRIANTLSIFSDTLSRYGSLDNFIASLKKGEEEAVQAFAYIGSAATGVVEAFAQIVGAADEVDRKIIKMAEGIGSALGAAAAAAIGLPPVVGAMAGQVGGAIVGSVISAFTSSRTTTLMEDTGREWGRSISQGLAEQISEDADRIGNTWAAELLNTADIIREVGITTLADLDHAIRKTHEILSVLDEGLASEEEVAASIGDSFREITDAMQRMGVTINMELIRMIRDVQSRGLEVREIVEFINQALDKTAGGLSQWVDAITELGTASAEEMRLIGSLALSAFNEAIKNGSTLAEAIERIADPLKKLREHFQQTGEEAPRALQKLFRLENLVSTNKTIIDSIDAMGAALEGLASIGAITFQDFQDTQTVLSQKFDELIAKGFQEKEALAIIAPQLALLRDIAAQYGFQLDENTQKLIQQAEAQGLLKSKAEEPMNMMVTALWKIVELLGGEIPAAAQKMIDAIYGVNQAAQQPAQTIGSWRGEILEDISLMKQFAAEMERAGAAAVETGGGGGGGAHVGGGFQRGGILDVNRPTRILVGEAGGEKVVVMRNPRTEPALMSPRIDFKIEVNAGAGADGRKIADEIVRALNENRQLANVFMRALEGRR